MKKRTMGLSALMLLAIACGESEPVALEPEPPTAVAASAPQETATDEALPADEGSAEASDDLAATAARGAGAGARAGAGAAEPRGPDAPTAEEADQAGIAEALAPLTPEQASAFHDVITRVVRIPRDRALRARARTHRMSLMSLTWEDTGRWIGSSVGPNISDMTLEVIERVPGRRRPRTRLMPVLRYPNFTDRTADVPAEQIMLRVGNQRPGGELDVVTLPELLSHLREYLTDPDDLRAPSDDFTAARDTHVLVSAQHVYVPVPPGMRVEFAPMLFNYQSEPGTPAVLCIVATREGTSVQIIENRPDSSIPGGWGQRLYFNHAGQRTMFTAERRSDVVARVEGGGARADDATALDEGADMVAIIQVPLRLPARARRSAGGGSGGIDSLLSGALGGGAGMGAGRGSGSDVERAVVGHGLDEGPFVETRGRRIRRDPRFPIRVTIQFYRATSNGVIDDADLDAAAAQIERVYADADYVGSLVVGSQARPTAHRVTP